LAGDIKTGWERGGAVAQATRDMLRGTSEGELISVGNPKKRKKDNAY